MHFNDTLKLMSIDDIIDFVDGLDGVLTLTPAAGDGTPELAWGDSFFYYSPTGVVPQATQPFATIVTKNYPDDEGSRLDRPGTFRVNVAAGKDEFIRWTGHPPRDAGDHSADADGSDAATADATMDDVVIAHPLYGELGWLAVVNPDRTEGDVRALLRTAYELARRRYERRAGTTSA